LVITNTFKVTIPSGKIVENRKKKKNTTVSGGVSAIICDKIDSLKVEKVYPKN
jgi:hypothetical protein